jgi:hypothetical protein
MTILKYALVVAVLASLSLMTYRPSVVRAQEITAIPKVWRTCKGSTATGQLIFEATDGTIHLTDNLGNDVLEIPRK